MWGVNWFRAVMADFLDTVMDIQEAMIFFTTRVTINFSNIKWFYRPVCLNSVPRFLQLLLCS
jgi:hypothetical protein